MTHDPRPTVSYALSAIEKTTGTTYTLLDDRPDEVDRQSKAIDFLARDDRGQLLGIEHTRLQAYEDQIRDSQVMHQRLGGMRELAAGRLPANFVG